MAVTIKKILKDVLSDLLGTLSKKSTGFDKYPWISINKLFGRRNSKLAIQLENDWHQKEHYIEFDFPHPSGMYLMVFRTSQRVLREKVLNP